MSELPGRCCRFYLTALRSAQIKRRGFSVDRKSQSPEHAGETVDLTCLVSRFIDSNPSHESLLRQDGNSVSGDVVWIEVLLQKFDGKYTFRKLSLSDKGGFVVEYPNVDHHFAVIAKCCVEFEREYSDASIWGRCDNVG
jgi:hypothetical protein